MADDVEAIEVGLREAGEHPCRNLTPFGAQLREAAQTIATLRAELEIIKTDRDLWRQSEATCNAQYDKLRADLAKLTEENRVLAAGSCDVDGDKLGDERGNSFCSLQAKLAKAVEGLEWIANGNFDFPRGYAQSILKELRP